MLAGSTDKPLCGCRRAPLRGCAPTSAGRRRARCCERPRHAHRVRRARAAADGAHLRHLGDDILGDAADAIGFSEADARLQHDADQNRALVERRQERARQQHAGEDRRADRDDRQTDDEGRVARSTIRGPTSAIASAARTSGVSCSDKFAHARQQPIAEHRRHGQRHDEAGEDRNDEGNAERREQAPLDAR